jgi:hypothetical protein
LVGKSRNQFDLLVCEGSHGLAHQYDDANNSLISQKRNS